MSLVACGRSVPLLLSLCGAALLAAWPTVSVAGPAQPAPAVAAAGGDPLRPSPGDAAPAGGIDWSVGLRGSYISDSQSGVRYQEQVLPSITLTHNAKNLSMHATADAQLSRTDDGAVVIEDARLSAGSALQFSPDAALVSNGALEMTQENPNSPDVASDVAATPVEISGRADSTFTRRFGRLKVSLGGKAERDVYGPTTLVTGLQTDNSGLNNTSGGGGLRLGFQLTPIVELFTAADATRTVFDGAAPGLAGAKLDGNLYTARAGASARWARLTASASIGAGLEHFDAPSLADVHSVLYDASLTFRPSETLTLNGSFTSTIAPPGPNGSGTAGITYAALAGATYQVNDWLDWRGSAGWSTTAYADSAQTNKDYTLGLGADYSLSRHSKLSADYNFDHSQQSVSPPDDTHKVTLGLTFQK